MASGFFAILDDIGALMDDIAVNTKMAANKTAGILGDDLAVSAEKATGFVASRELPVLWAITKGSLLNKLMIIPVALLLNAFFPVAITAILLLGGFYLAYEAVENIIGFFFPHSQPQHNNPDEKSGNQQAAEKNKIKAAITTDFILSVEIVIIALGSVLDKSLSIQIITVSIIALLATIGVYGIVALIVRMDDAGLALIKSSANKGLLAVIGRVLVGSLPVLIRVLSIVGTIALLLVAGNILIHNLPALHLLLPGLPAIVREIIFGLAGGLSILGIVKLGKLIFRK